MAEIDRPLLFVSDAHLGAGSDEQERVKSQRLHAFWDYVDSEGADLVIVGDLFDFWFEYRNAVPRDHWTHLWALRRLADHGRRIWYVAGNHDFWAGRFFKEELGLSFHPDELAINQAERTVTFTHGDGWLPREHGYRLMKRVFRNPTAIAAFRLISPDIGFPLARWVAGRSRGRHTLDLQALATYTAIARQRLQSDCDVLVTGHLHEVGHYHWPEGDWLLCGDWMEHFSFGRLEGGVARLYSWRDDGVHAAVPIDEPAAGSTAPATS